MLISSRPRVIVCVVHKLPCKVVGVKYGVMVGEGSGAAPELNALVKRAKFAERVGLDTAWIGNIAIDATTAAAVVGAATNTIEIGTSVTPIHTHHPAAMLQQAETTQMACDGRFTLGLGVGHKFRVEGIWGLSYDRPASRMRAYLEALVPALAGENITCNNEFFNVTLQANPEAPQTNVLIAALGPVMLELAGELTGGTITWATGPNTLRAHVLPNLKRKHANPRIVAGFPVLLTANHAQAKEAASRLFGMYGRVPSYKAMIEREGVESVDRLALIGNEQDLAKRLDEIASIGVTDFCGFLFETESGEIERTLQFLASRP